MSYRQAKKDELKQMRDENPQEQHEWFNIQKAYEDELAQAYQRLSYDSKLLMGVFEGLSNEICHKNARFEQLKSDFTDVINSKGNLMEFQNQSRLKYNLEIIENKLTKYIIYIYNNHQCYFKNRQSILFEDSANLQTIISVLMAIINYYSADYRKKLPQIFELKEKLNSILANPGYCQIPDLVDFAIKELIAKINQYLINFMCKDF